MLGGAHLGVFLDGDEGADREPDGALSVDVQVGRLLAALLPPALPLHAAQLYIDNVYSTGKYFCFVWPQPTGIQQSEGVAVVAAGPRELLPLAPELGQVAALLPLLALPGLRRRRGVRVRQPRGGGGHARHLARPAATWPHQTRG